MARGTATQLVPLGAEKLGPATAPPGRKPAPVVGVVSALPATYGGCGCDGLATAERIWLERPSLRLGLDLPAACPRARALAVGLEKPFRLLTC